MDVPLGISEGKGLSGRSNVKHAKETQDIDLPNIASVWVYQVQNVHLTLLRDYNARRGHPGMHPHECRTGWEGDGGSR